jgi:hypothetical protein
MLRVMVFMLLGMAAAAQSNIPPNTKIMLERSGHTLDLTCPVYKIAIDGEGFVTYEGKHAVHAVGFRKAKIQPSTVRLLVERMLNQGYFDFPESYGVCDDGGMVKTSLEVDGRRKSIEDGCQAGPEALRRLEDEIDHVSGSDRWVRGRMLGLWPSSQHPSACGMPPN